MRESPGDAKMWRCATRNPAVSERDRLFADGGPPAPGFVFDERVVRVFPDMITRSVPGYGLVVPLTGLLARRYVQAGSRLYDLGCSLGAAAIAMRDAIDVPVREIVAVDRSEAMVRRLHAHLDEHPAPGRPPIRAERADLLETPIEDASVVVMNFTLQFIERGRRAGLLRRIFAGLRPGGVLILSEKLRFDSAAEQELQTGWHHEFKRAQGYSDLEIARKRDALEEVLVPDTLDQHHRRLEESGFAPVIRWFQAFSFVSLAAFRPAR